MHHEYNEHHDLVHTWDSDGRETLYTYDQEHNPVRTMEKIKEGKWKETARKYDFRGRCILERDALGNESLKEYEASRAYPSRVITPKGEETLQVRFLTSDCFRGHWYPPCTVSFL